jgi:nicotinate-nucleotide adenylyltransferase
LRLGILGGTFDPIHFGHLRLAEEVGEGLKLERVYLVPAALPPHKEVRPVTPFRQRVAMARLAARESPLLEIHDLEGRREGFSYSVETLRQFHGLFGPSTELFFIVGMDAFLEIETWKEYQALFGYAHFVVIKRPGFPSGKLEPFLASLGLGIERTGESNVFAGASGNKVIYMEVTMMAISSTGIREKVAAGKSIRFLVPEEVRSYIIKKRLYEKHGAT